MIKIYENIQIRYMIYMPLCLYTFKIFLSVLKHPSAVAVSVKLSPKTLARIDYYDGRDATEVMHGFHSAKGGVRRDLTVRSSAAVGTFLSFFFTSSDSSTSSTSS